VLLAALGWKLLMDAFQAARAAIPASQWLEVRYEDVLADPRRQIAVMLEFLGLQWTSDFDAGFSRYVFETGRREAFRRDLDADNLALLEQSLAGHLKAYRYAPAIQPDGEGPEPRTRPRAALSSKVVAVDAM
jgi:hypothetical protein